MSPDEASEAVYITSRKYITDTELERSADFKLRLKELYKQARRELLAQIRESGGTVESDILVTVQLDARVKYARKTDGLDFRDILKETNE